MFPFFTLEDFYLILFTKDDTILDLVYTPHIICVDWLEHLLNVSAYKIKGNCSLNIFLMDLVPFNPKYTQIIFMVRKDYCEMLILNEMTGLIFLLRFWTGLYRYVWL